jgi:hypothetical protein
VLSIGRARTSARSHSREEVVGHGESMFAHGGGRGKAEATVGELEANVGEAVVAGALEVRRRGVVEEAATASSGGGRSIAGSRSGCLHAEVHARWR